MTKATASKGASTAPAEADPDFKPREITATIGELHRSNWQLADMTNVLQTNIKAESVELGDLTPAGQDIVFCVITRLLSRQFEMLDHLKETLEIGQIDWEDLYIKKLSNSFDVVSQKNRCLKMNQKRKGGES